MESLEKTIKSTVAKELAHRKNDSDFLSKQDFLLEVKDKGLMMPQKYGIAPLDTVGKRRFLAQHKTK